MQTRDTVDLLLLSLLWGAAYLFMRSAGPATRGDGGLSWPSAARC